MRFFGVCKKISVTLHSVFHSIIKIKVKVCCSAKRDRPIFLYYFYPFSPLLPNINLKQTFVLSVLIMKLFKLFTGLFIIIMISLKRRPLCPSSAIFRDAFSSLIGRLAR